MAQPSEQDLYAVLQLLYNNGIVVSNAKAAYQDLQNQRANPNFCMALTRIFGSPQCVVGATLPGGSWEVYRHLAGLELKNSVETAHHQLGEAVVANAARTSVEVLQTGTNANMIRTAAQIVVKVTAVAGLAWWDATFGVAGYLPNLLLLGPQSLMASTAATQILGALYAVQYLLEDVPKQLGESSCLIVDRVVNVVVMAHADPTVRKVAFRVACHPYEIGKDLDWEVDVLSPMQVGLCNASLHLVRATNFMISSGSQDPVILVLALRSMILLLDYLMYFVKAMPSDEFNATVQGWVGSAVWYIENPQTDKEVKSVAADLLQQITTFYDRCGGEGPIAAFVPLIVSRFKTLLPALISHTVFTEDEIAAIMEKDDYTHRDSTAVSVPHHGRIEEDESLDEEEAAATLRRSASRCIDSCCQLSEADAFPLILAAAGSGWTHADWRNREVALLILGACVDGCYNLLSPHLPTVAPQLIALASNQSEHICVVSMALWTIQRIATWLLVEAEGMAHLLPCFNACIGRMPSNSKRIQSASTTALVGFYTTASTMSCQTGDFTICHKLLPSLSTLVQTLHSCLPVFHTGCLAQLCKLSLYVAATLQSDNEVFSLTQPFFVNRDARMAKFIHSYTACYVEGQSTAMVDKDVFSLDQVIVATHMRGSVPPTAGQQDVVALLGTWVSVLQDVVSRNVTDDADLLYNMLFTCCNFIGVCSTATLLAWSTQSNCALALAACSLLSTLKHQFVRAAALMLLTNMLTVLPNAAIPHTAVVPLTQILGKILEEDSDFPESISDTSKLIVALFISSPQSVECQMLVQRVSGKLRSDCFGDALLHYNTIAVELCRAVSSAPACISAHINFTVLFEVLKQAPNGPEKSTATIRVKDGIMCQPQNAFPTFIGEMLRFAFSWQQGAVEYPGTLEALTQMLHQAKTAVFQMMLDQLNLLAPDFRQQFLVTYRLQ